MFVPLRGVHLGEEQEGIGVVGVEPEEHLEPGHGLAEVALARELDGLVVEATRRVDPGGPEGRGDRLRRVAVAAVRVGVLVARGFVEREDEALGFRHGGRSRRGGAGDGGGVAGGRVVGSRRRKGRI